MTLALIINSKLYGSILSLNLSGIFIAGLTIFTLHRVFVLIERGYAKKYRKPLFRDFSIYKQKLNSESKLILESNFSFYKQLSNSQKQLFEHRLACFINDKKFIGREGLAITPEKKVLIGATAIMLTFGYRDYLIRILSNIVIYPDSFYSKINDNLHNGEFNPKLNTLVLSWKHFKEGYNIENDNLNLGIHEFTHAIHIDSIYNSGVNSIIFNQSYKELKGYLDANEDIKTKLIESRYFREYAYTNQFEFIAVIVETFLETPILFEAQFPFLYKKVKQMLNFK